tara:strand:- start:727 stop:942 length:216 start_codon:yes stop_codon:yes gene_type:complete
MSDNINELARQMRERALALEGASVPEVIYERVYEPSEDHKKLYFNAGRWSAGATDWTARKAYEEFMKEEGK